MNSTKQIHFHLDKAELDRKRAANQRRERGEPERPKPEPKQPLKKKGSKPAQGFLDGFIETRVWENKGDDGRPDWKIEQVRLYRYTERQGEAKSFRHADLKDARHGLCKAGLWIEKEERHRGLRRRSWWWPFS